MHSQAGNRSNWPVYASLVTTSFAVIYCLLHFIDFATTREFRVDEFEYAHASWLVSHGAVPFRDFFEHHFSLPFQIISPLWWLGNDSLSDISRLRSSSIGYLLLLAAGATYLVRRQGPLAQVCALVGTLTFQPLIERAIEIRPDIAGLSLYFLALVLLDAEFLGARTKAGAAGLVTGLALLCSVKVWFYGLPLAALWLRDAFYQRKLGAGVVVRSPLVFALSALTPVALYSVWLVSVGAAGQFWLWCFDWAGAHEGQVRLFSPWPQVWSATASVPLFWLVLPLGAYCVVRDVVSKAQGHVVAGVTLLSCVSGLWSFAIQKAPYPYSLMPYLAFVVLLGSRGLAEAVDQLTRWFMKVRGKSSGNVARARTLSWCLAPILAATLGYRQAPTELDFHANRAQLHELRRWNDLIGTDEVVYDNMGRASARRHAYYFYFTNHFLRQSRAKRFAEEIPTALVGTHTTVWINDQRTAGLPESVQQYLRRHFVRVDGDLSVWGARLLGKGPGEFYANRQGSYYVWPREAHASIKIDEATMPSSGEVQLSQGTHQVASEFSDPCWLIWLPNTREHLRPLPPSPPHGVRL